MVLIPSSLAPLRAAIPLAVLLAAAWVAVLSTRPPDVVGAAAPQDVFSAERAARHLEIIARAPRLTGSPAAAEVRAYLQEQLRSLGMEVESQATFSQYRLRGDSVTRAGNIENVIGRWPGTRPGAKAILVSAHYDSTESGPGAGDNGAAVASILEVLRALRTNGPLESPLIVLFADGEEAGLLGANAFVQHPWLRDAGLVLNLDARGASGPAIMFETSPGNNELLSGFSTSVQRATTSSLAIEVYRFMPNDTDFTVFASAGLPGFNFAFIEAPGVYHTSLDTVRNLDLRSLQHQGSQVLALVRHYSHEGVPPQGAQAGGAIYFDILGRYVAHYSQFLATALAVIELLAVALLFWLKIRAREWTARGLLWGLASVAAGVLITPALLALVITLFSCIFPNANALIELSAGDVQLYFAAVVVLTGGLGALVVLPFCKRAAPVERLASALALWALLALTSAVFVPGASYLLAWPLAGALVGVVLMSQKSHSRVLLAVCAVPGLVLVLHAAYLVVVSLSISVSPIAAALLLSLLGTLSLVLLGAERAAFACAGGVTGIALLFVIFTRASPSGERPLPTQLVYALDADQGSAVWASSNTQLDEWVRQVIPPDARRAQLKSFFPRSEALFWQQEAPLHSLPGPSVERLEDRAEGDHRRVRLRIWPGRAASMLRVYVTNVRSATLFDRPAWVTEDRRMILLITSPPLDGVEETLLLDANEQDARVHLITEAAGLPEIGPRPAWLIADPFIANEATLVSASFPLSP